MEEDWKQIPGLEKYEASTLGKIRSSKFKRQIKITLNKNGYERVMYHDGDIKDYHTVARLILLTFIGIPLNGEEASHLNGKQKDNRLCNLKWETHQKNMKRIKRFKIKIFSWQITFTIRRIK